MKKTIDQVYPEITYILKNRKTWVEFEDIVLFSIARFGDRKNLWNDEVKNIRSITYMALCDAILGGDRKIKSRQTTSGHEFSYVWGIYN